MSDQRVFESASVGMLVLSAEGQVIRCNSALESIVGYSSQDFSRLPPAAWIHPADRETCAELMARLIRREIPSIKWENRIVHKDGHIVWVRQFVSLLPGATSTSDSLLSLVIDITDRRIIDQANHEREDRLKAILSTAVDAIITIDLKGIIQTVNHSSIKMFGYAEEEMLGRNVSLLMPRPYSEEHDQYLERYAAGGAPRVIGIGREATGLRKDGTTFPVSLAISQIDHLGLFVGILRDVTEQKLMQKQILEIASDEQRRIGLELHDGVAQELTGLSLFARSLCTRLASAEELNATEWTAWRNRGGELDSLREIANKMSQALSDAQRHVQQLSHGMMPVQLDSLGLRAALDELASSVNVAGMVSCEFENLNAITTLDNESASHLYRIAQEAVQNALKHGRSTHIAIRLLKDQTQVILEVVDNGIGIDPGVLRTPAATQAGLRNMHYRASLMGGILSVENVPKGGVRVRCVLTPQRQVPPTQLGIG